MIWIGYTTRYRTGGARLAQAARTMARQTSGPVVCEAVESKADFVAAMGRLSALDELHLISHSGMYGPIFGTTDLPEQFSPHEWRRLEIPWSSTGRASTGRASTGRAFFHACRTGRWFAPFFARTQGVPSFGHHWYTTLSRDPQRYRIVRDSLGSDEDVYIVGQPGRKSHGLLGSAGKHLGLLPPVPMQRSEPEQAEPEGYERVAELYDRCFEDIRVRGPEWRWLDQRVDRAGTVLDLGCGTGALLRALQPAVGLGVDTSEAMLACARRRSPSTRFERISGPSLPLPDSSVDTAISLLSWRYLDWDPMLTELVRVLRPGGRLLVVDMAASPASPREWPTMLGHKLRERRHLRDFPDFAAARARLVSEPAWARMLQFNPIRAEHEYRWYLESRFPGRTVELLDLGRTTRVLGFDSGPITASWFPPQSYP